MKPKTQKRCRSRMNRTTSTYQTLSHFGKLVLDPAIVHRYTYISKYTIINLVIFSHTKNLCTLPKNRGLNLYLQILPKDLF